MLFFGLYSSWQILFISSPFPNERLTDFFLFALEILVVVFLGLELNSLKKILLSTFVMLISSFYVCGKIIFIFLTTISLKSGRPILENANGDPNLSAWIIGLSIPLSFCFYFLALDFWPKLEKSKLFLALIYLCAMVSLSGLICTQSRSGILIFICSSLVMILN